MLNSISVDFSSRSPDSDSRCWRAGLGEAECPRSRALLAVALILAIGLPACSGSELQDDTKDVVSTSSDLMHVFPTNRVPHIQLDFEDGFEAVVWYFGAEGDLSYREAAFKFDEEELPSTGARIKGKVAYGIGQIEDKIGLKVNFDYFGGPRFHNVDSVHFLNNKPDPSNMREVLAVKVYDEMDVQVTRASFVTVQVDGVHYGLYTMVEDLDKRFLKFRFGTENDADDGNLYKCVAPGCSLEYRGEGREKYLVECGDEECGLVLKTNEDDPTMNDYADLIDFLKALNETSDANF